ncbi:MAG: secondary thiamine-phosphate synthase enzyme YjbQ [Acidimicrobiia bacterium]|nr:secondary thiamine-phosphate synthase enzyme YjbQ [Acidimicrobiia bacterium]
MTFRSTEFEVVTGDRPTVVDVTSRVAAVLEPGDEGLVNVFAPHATCGLAILETGAGSDPDLLSAVEDLLPADDRWQHRHGSPGHGRDHVLPAWIAPSIVVPVIGGTLSLGTWQSIVLVDTNVDNRVRRVRVSVLV